MSFDGHVGVSNPAGQKWVRHRGPVCLFPRSGGAEAKEGAS
jgi:hypothetical protein